MKKLAQDFNTVAQDSNPGSRSQEFKALPLSHCALNVACIICDCPDVNKPPDIGSNTSVFETLKKVFIFNI